MNNETIYLFLFLERWLFIEKEKILNERFKVLEKLIKNGYTTDKKIINLKTEDLILNTNMNRSDLMIAIKLKNALANKKLITFLCGIDEDENKSYTNIREEKTYE